MNGAHILKLYRDQLTNEVLERVGDLPRFDPLNISPWLAMSLMQKTVRRGREEQPPAGRCNASRNLSQPPVASHRHHGL